MVEHTLGKGEVTSSSLVKGSRKLGRVVEGAALEMLLGGLPLREFESLSFRLPWFAEIGETLWGTSLWTQFRFTPTRHPYDTERFTPFLFLYNANVAFTRQFYEDCLATYCRGQLGC